MQAQRHLLGIFYVMAVALVVLLIWHFMQCYQIPMVDLLTLEQAHFFLTCPILGEGSRWVLEQAQDRTHQAQAHRVEQHKQHGLGVNG
jgi:hypothetical protein